MNCPQCGGSESRRCRRYGIRDYIIGITGIRPWRCADCEHRFYATVLPVRLWGVAHCDRCGNMNLQPIAREYGMSSLAWLFRLLHVPAYRCAPCRNRFFSMRPHRGIVPASERAAIASGAYRPAVASSPRAGLIETAPSKSDSYDSVNKQELLR